MNLHVGTSGYNFPEWKGTFYPAKMPEAQMLEYYAQRLGTVEINYTFYRMPNPKVVAGWDRVTPPGFTFVLKAPQRITHHARLRDVDDPLRYFLETARQLGGKLGAILFQLPPNFKKDLDRLNDLLTQFPPDVRCAWEFRHPSWFADDVYEALRGGNAALCVADTEDGHTPLVATADWGYMRLRDEGYTPTALAEWRKTVEALGKGWHDGFVFFKHEESGIGPKLAQQFAALVPA
ncbi:MAG TPA: DUF72 domain-containing protein [Candidatus Dormibacteraeota bacterium]|nr:DUF72 domain-containing protein [Candidatus Dormibacteraeota bacterium]